MTVVIVNEDGTVTPAIRKLTEEEHGIYSGAVVRALIMLPAFRDAVALMRPFADLTADTAYTDKYSRVGLSQWFFHELDVMQRASVILHEAFHVVNNTFTRGAALGAEPDFGNIASDLEINCSLHKLPQVDLSFGVMPDRKPFSFEKYLTMEQYYHLIKNNEDLQKQLRPQQGQGKPDPNCPQHGKNSQSSQGKQGSEPGDEKDSSKTSQADGQGSDAGGNSGGHDKGQTKNADSGTGDGTGDSSQSGGNQPGSASSSGSGSGHSSGQSGPPCTCPKNHGGSGQPKSGAGSGTTKGCDEANEARSEAADEIGIERASDAEQSIAKKNTVARLEEELKKQRAAGTGSMAEFLSLALKNMQPPQVNWRKLFRRIVSTLEEAIVRGRSDYSYRRTSRRLSNSQFIFPGMIKYQPSIMVGIDTSGSMSHEDHLRAASEVEGILKAVSRAKNSLRIFSVDTNVKNTKVVDSVRKLDLRGGGGTAMEVAWKYAKSLPTKEQPDIFVNITDGYTAWQPVEDEVLETQKKFKSVILVTTSGGYKSVPESLRRLTHVIDISDGRDADQW